MSFPNSSLPIPMYAIDKNLNILKANQAAVHTFALGKSILEIIEPESRSKMERHILQSPSIEALEINALSSSGEVLLADFYVSWDDQMAGEVAIIKKDRAIIKVSEQLGRIRSRLNETNFELLEAKETAENLLEENIRLSSPFIELTDTVALVPIFGGLDEHKSEIIASTLTRRAYTSNVETVIIDFTAVGHIEQGGLNGFEKLVSMLQLLGFSILVSGLHPGHVKEWKELEFTSDIQFKKSLRLAIQSLLSAKSAYRNKEVHQLPSLMDMKS